MSHFLRARQAGIQRDLSAGLGSQHFAIDEIVRYGINARISAIAYDPVQSLLAVGTSDYGQTGGQVYVYGQNRVQVILKLPRRASVRILHFCADKLVCCDSKNDISFFSLATTHIITSYSPPGAIASLTTDPALDYAFIGLQNGEVIAYDMDRCSLAPFRIPNLWREQNIRARLLPVVTLSFHPRHIGNLLIGYAEGAVIFSFQQNQAIKFFHRNVSTSRATIEPRLTQAIWHPGGINILTAYDDATYIIWDVKDGRQISHRDINFGEPASNATIPSSHCSKIAWCAKANADETGILFAGAQASSADSSAMTFLDLGPSPIYATSSWQALKDHFEYPKSQKHLPIPPNTTVMDFCLIPRSSPHFAGACDPVAVIAVLSSGELITLSFPSGHPITATNYLHPSLSFVYPFADTIAMAYVDRLKWLGLCEQRSQGPRFIKGGVEAIHSQMQFAFRNIIVTAHVDGVIRLWDAGHGDEVENKTMLQVDVARALDRYTDTEISAISLASTSGELAVGLSSGELVIFRWGRNPNHGREVPHAGSQSFGLEDIQDRSEPNLKEGFLPLRLYQQQNARVTVVKMSDIGFVCAGFQNGALIIIDMRGPAVIFEGNVENLGQHKRSSLRRETHHSDHGGKEWATCVEFGVMMLGDEDYSSISLFVGTNSGRVSTFKLLPASTGGYSAEIAGSVSAEGSLVSLTPIDVDSGEVTSATPLILNELRNGIKINGVILAVTSTGAKLYKPPAAKGASKAWENRICYKATHVRFEGNTYALIGLYGDGTAKAFSLPGMKEIASRDVSHILDIRRLADAIITPTGLVFGWSGPSEIVMLNVWGTGQDLSRSLDKLFNPDAMIPPRPTISNLQWISGTTHVTPSDIDKLVGGPDRPPSKRMIAQMRADEEAHRVAAQAAKASSSASSRNAPSGAAQQEGYWAYMQRQIQERTETLGLTGDSMDKLEGNSQGFADDVNKFIKDQKKAAVKGFITSKLGF